MPSSTPSAIEVVIGIAWRLGPKSVVDLGVGYGKYGVLFREYLELKHQPDRLVDSARSVRIDGVEGYGPYLGPLQRATYDELYVENILDFLKRGQHYDLVFLGDVLEHFEKNVASTLLLPGLVAIADMGVLIVTPVDPGSQGAVAANDLEVHRSRWTAEDFKGAAPYVAVGRKSGQLVAFLTNKQNCYRRVRPKPLRNRLRALKHGFCDYW